ncbi:MAG: hypothetical protein SV062_02020 [Thermodesulfobacteriota bacterium]|nr:hypothetical protein [Thermodesulfobacteriota bacterium]
MKKLNIIYILLLCLIFTSKVGLSHGKEGNPKIIGLKDNPIEKAICDNLLEKYKEITHLEIKESMAFADGVKKVLIELNAVNQKGAFISGQSTQINRIQAIDNAIKDLIKNLKTGEEEGDEEEYEE